METVLSEESKAKLRKLRDEFPYYSERCLKIRSKSGALIPLKLNSAQRYIHEKLEEQKQNTGRVRAYVLKGRQQGVSTYIEARYFHKTQFSKGIRTFILTHHFEATKNIFEIANRYYDHLPEAIKPHAGASSEKELYFDRLDTGYRVGTAGMKETGRSATIQLLHGSEAAFWPHADTHAQGILQTVPSEDNTEIIFESTGNGIGNTFFKGWQAAVKGDSEYIAIFVPWYWQEEYRSPVPKGFSLIDEEMGLKRLYDLDDEQIVWRRNKISEFQGDVSKFKQEYPCTPDEAFQFSGGDSLIQSEVVMAARKCVVDNPFTTKIIGVDPARFGEDSTAVWMRMGRKAVRIAKYKKLDNMQVAGHVARIIDLERPDATFIDVGGLGAGIVDRLRELNYKIIPVNFGEKALDSETYFNRRAEMWCLMRDWLVEQPADIPDENDIHMDLTGPHYSYDSNQRTRLEKKEDMLKRDLASPDDGDALALTFAEPVRPRDGSSNQPMAQMDYDEFNHDENWPQRGKGRQTVAEGDYDEFA